MTLLDQPRNSSWIGCIDFGTTLSKLAIVRARPRDKLEAGDIKIFAIADRKRFPVGDARLLPSSVFIHNDAIVFGAEAEDAGNKSSDRYTFTSMKQYLSTHDLTELDVPLPENIDPTGDYTARIALELFLAHLLMQANIVAKVARSPWPVPLRIARPAWETNRADQGEAELKRIVVQAFALADTLGQALIKDGGVSHEQVFEALKKTKNVKADVSRIFKLDTSGSASVLEATAVAVASIRGLDDRRRFVEVVDIGGGTADFGAFMTGLPGNEVLASLQGSSHILRQAGDHLDMLLRRYILDQLGYVEDDFAALGASRDLRRRQRLYKEELFTKNRILVRVGDDALEVAVDDFLASSAVRRFADRLRETFLQSLEKAILAARYFSLPTNRIPVEIVFTGGGHALPMVRALSEHGLGWDARPTEPDLKHWPSTPNRQLVVAVGGAILDLPNEAPPLA